MSAARSPMARRLPWIALLLVAAVALIIGSGAGRSPSIDDQVVAIASTIRCPECSGQSSATSEANTAVAIRNDIRERLEQGQTADEIRDYYAGSFEESILLNPPRSGAGRVVWVLPVVVVVASFGGLGLALRRWRRTDDEAATDEDRALVAAARAGNGDVHGEGAGR